MTEQCLTLGCPDATRFTKQDPCSGESIPGAGNGYVLTCIRNWSIEPIVREGEAAEFVSDCGNMVVRDKQDDQLLGYTISFETSTRSNELESLLTGAELITSGGNSIGSYKNASNLACDTPSTDPRFIVELFYKLSRCVTGADHVRWVLPLAQFKVTETDREGTITFYRYTAETGISSAQAFGSGPYLDFPADIAAFLAAQDPDEFTAGFDFEEQISIAGACGTIDVPSPALAARCDINGTITVDTVTSPSFYELIINGTGFDNTNIISLYLGGSQVGLFFSDPVDGFPTETGGSPPADDGTVLAWTPTLIHIQIEPQDFVTWDLTGIQFLCIPQEFPNDPTPMLFYDVTPPLSLYPCGTVANIIVDSVSSPGPGEFRIEGSGFSASNGIHIESQLDGPPLDVFDPIGIRAGSQSPNVTILSWSDTTIHFSDATDIHGWCVNEVNFYCYPDDGITSPTLYLSYSPSPCQFITTTCEPSPGTAISSLESINPTEIRVQGSDFLYANTVTMKFTTNHPVTGTQIKNYFDPDGPLNYLNTAEDPSVDITRWRDSQIIVSDPGAAGLCIEQVDIGCYNIDTEDSFLFDTELYSPCVDVLP